MLKKKGKYFWRLILFAVSITFLGTAQAHPDKKDFINDKVALSDNGTAAVVCHTSPQQGGSVFLIILNSDDDIVGQPVVVNSNLTGYGQNADVGIDSHGTISVVWEQIQSNSSAVYWTQFSSTGIRIVPARLLTNSRIIATTPQLSTQRTGKWVACWLDYRSGHPEVYAQKFRSNGQLFGNNFLVAKSNSLIQYPNVSLAEDSTICFGWQDSGLGHFHVEAKLFKWNGEELSDTILVDDSNGKASSSNPDILQQMDGRTIVLWKDYRTGESNIYFQRIQGTALESGNELVNDDSTRRWQRLPSISGSRIGKFICVWEDYRNDPKNQIGDIYAQWYSSDGRKIGGNVKINAGPEPTVQEFPAVAMNSSGECIITWNDARNSEIQVFLRRWSLDAETFGNEKKIMPND